MNKNSNEDKTHISCDDIIALASDYYEGDISEVKRLKFDKHFEECAECKNFFKEFLFTIDIVCGPCKDEYESIKMPKHVEERIIDYLVKK